MKTAAELAERVFFLTAAGCNTCAVNCSCANRTWRSSESVISHQLYSSFTSRYITNCQIQIEMQESNTLKRAAVKKKQIIINPYKNSSPVAYIEDAGGSQCTSLHAIDQMCSQTENVIVVGGKKNGIALRWPLSQCLS